MKNKNFLIPVIGFDEIIVDYAKGSFVFDSSNKKYLDLNSGQFCTVFGHCNSEIDYKIKECIDSIVHTSTGMLSEKVLEFSQKMHQITNDIDGYSILLSTGAEAVEFCLRYAKAIKNKDGIVCFNVGYHGLTLGAQSVTYGGVYTHPHINSIYPFEVPNNLFDEKELEKSIGELKELLKKKHNNIAAVLFEPIVSVGGMIFPPEKFFCAVRKICDEFGILLIFDECQTGFGRLGEWFAYQKINVKPDMLATAKGVGAGFPVAISIINGKWVPKEGLMPITHFSSHQNDNFAACTVLAGINYIEKHKILNMVKVKGELFLNELKALEKRCKFVKNARGSGLMMGIDLHSKFVHNYRAVYQEIHQNILKNGVIIQGTNGGKTLRFLPDYLMTIENFKFAISVIENELNSLDWSMYAN